MNKDVITVTDKQEVAFMKTKDIRGWISLHRKALKDDSMKEHYFAIKNDLRKLEDEYNLRFPLVAAIKDLTDMVKQLNETLKEKQNGNTKD